MQFTAPVVVVLIARKDITLRCIRFTFRKLKRGNLEILSSLPRCVRPDQQSVTCIGLSWRTETQEIRPARYSCLVYVPVDVREPLTRQCGPIECVRDHCVVQVWCILFPCRGVNVCAEKKHTRAPCLVLLIYGFVLELSLFVLGHCVQLGTELGQRGHLPQQPLWRILSTPHPDALVIRTTSLSSRCAFIATSKPIVYGKEPISFILSLQFDDVLLYSVLANVTYCDL